MIFRFRNWSHLDSIQINFSQGGDIIMSNLAIVSIISGLFFIAIRSPLIFSPETTAVYYRKLIASNKRIRILGTFMAMLSLAMISSAQHSDQTAANIISIVGWLIVFLALPVLLIFPSFYKWLADFFFDTFSDSIILPIKGIIDVCIGAYFVYIGIWVF